MEVIDCNFHRYDYLEFTDARGAKTRYDTKVGTEKWPKVSTFKIMKQIIYPVLVSPYDFLWNPVMLKGVCFYAWVCLLGFFGGGQEMEKSEMLQIKGVNE